MIASWLDSWAYRRVLSIFAGTILGTMTGLSCAVKTTFASMRSTPTLSVLPVEQRQDVESQLMGHGEVIIVFVGAASCVFSQPSLVRPAIAAAVSSVVAEASTRQVRYRTVGVALDFSQAIGSSYLRSVGTFDEVITDRRQYPFGEFVLNAATPQVVILERVSSQRGSPSPSDSSPVLRLRIIGHDELQLWAKRGARIPALPRLH